MTRPVYCPALLMTLVRPRLAILGLLTLSAAAAPVAAQAPAAPPPVQAAPVDAPPGPFAIDARFAMPSFNTGSAVADPLGLCTAQLPSRGWGCSRTAPKITRGRR